MATFTHLSPQDAERVSQGHGLGSCSRIVPIQAGTVNSNYLLETHGGEVFLRIYEQQREDGVAYEWQLLEHLARHGVPVPRRLGEVRPGEVRVSGRPVAVFERVVGEDLCQARVTAAHLVEVGSALGKAHRAGESFSVVRESRFSLAQLAPMLSDARGSGRPELIPVVDRLDALREQMQGAIAGPLCGLPAGVIHGDLFRDNVLWREGRLEALLDWESASHGTAAYDLSVTLLAWCCGDELSWELGAALVQGYQQLRPLADAEWEGLWWACRLACLRFATTRITDVYLRGEYPAGYKPFGRFLQRLDAIEQLSPSQLADKLGRRDAA